MKKSTTVNIALLCAVVPFAANSAYAATKTNTPFDRFLAWSMQAKDAGNKMWDLAVLGTIRDHRPEARMVRVTTTENGDFVFGSAKTSGQIRGIEQNADVSLQYSFVDDSEARTVVIYGKATLEKSFNKTTSSGEVVEYVTYHVRPSYYKFNHLDFNAAGKVHIENHLLDDGKWYLHKQCHYPSKDCQKILRTPYAD